MRFLLGLMLVIPFVTSAVAQRTDLKAKESARQFQVLGLAPSPALTELYYLRSATDAIPLEISTTRLSPSQSAGGGPVVFGVRRNDAQGKTIYVPVAQVEWPKESGDHAIIFIAVNGSGAATKVQAVAVNNSLSVFPARSLRVINFSGKTLFGQYAAFRGEVAPGPGRAVAYPDLKPVAKGGVPRFQIAFGSAGAEGVSSKILFNGWTEAWPSARTLVLITPSVNASITRPQVRFVVDALQEESPSVK